jgi:hypothetical protein
MPTIAESAADDDGANYAILCLFIGAFFGVLVAG